MRLAALIAAAALLAGCQSPCPVTDAAPVSFVYDCEDGSSLNVTYFRNPTRARVEQEGYAPAELTARGGSSLRYSGHGVDLLGSYSRVRLSRPGAADTECREQSPRANAPASPVAQRDFAIRVCRI